MKFAGHCALCLTNCEKCAKGWVIEKEQKICKKECHQNIEEKTAVEGELYFECKKIEKDFLIKWESSLQIADSEKGIAYY